jgi:Uma2 family endonuclease
MVRSGILDEDEPVELIGGELIRMSPQGNLHAQVTARLRSALERVHAGRAFGRDHSPLPVGRHDLPEPDIAIVRGGFDDWFDRTPGGEDTILVVEISSTSRRKDLDRAQLYASGGVPVYWMVDIVRRRVTVHETPSPDGYRLIRTLTEDETLAVPESDRTWRVADVLPPPNRP